MRIISSIRCTLFAFVVLAMSASAFAQLSISVSLAPPELPVYDQPQCPGDGYLWTPGYWAYAENDYYFVPGTWVMAPEPGLLWTPAYWSWRDNGYFFNEGYWGEHVGFYGGISYGYGYFGDGYQGGHWQGREFYYNRSVSNVNVTVIHNVYNTTVIHNTTVNRISYNGGNGGITTRPRPDEEVAAREHHTPPVAMQTQHEQTARANPEQRASTNHGTPQVAATPKPGAFNDHAAVHASPSGKPYNPPVRAAAEREAVKPAANKEKDAAPERPNGHPESARPESNRPATAQPADRPEPGKTEPARNEPPRNESARPEPARPEPARPEPTRPTPAPPSSDRSQTERSKPETSKPEPRRQQDEKPKRSEKPKQEEKPQ